jgi:hypothetical protein
MSDLILYYFFHIVPLLVMMAIPLYFIITPIRSGLERIEKTFTK